MTLNVGFIESARGRLFQAVYTPDSGIHVGSVLYVHPFAEEHNKSRRMAARQARQLASAGYVVAMLDLYGCGDSEGDFEDAGWADWLDDLRAGVYWLIKNHPGPLVLWGLRTGCLLIGEYLARGEEIGQQPAANVFWQPVISGDQYLKQFLRLRVAAGMLSGSRESTAELRERLLAGDALEVAGYEISPRLAGGLVAARLSPPPTGKVHWLEVVSSESGTLGPASRQLIDDWLERGIDVSPGVCHGEAFWGTQEIREVPDLLLETSKRLTGGPVHERG